MAEDYSTYDDADSIAHAKAQRAISKREVSFSGVLRMLEHEAEHENDAFGTVVIDPELLEIVASGDAALRDELVGEARVRWPKAKGGLRDRLLYALVRVQPPGPDAIAGLRGTPHDAIAALRALTDGARGLKWIDPAVARFAVLPDALLPALEPLARGSDPVDLVVTALVRIRSASVAPLLLEALERDELRARVIDEVAADPPRTSALVEVPDAIVARFERAAAKIEQARTKGTADRVELLVVAGIAALVRKHDAIARRALTIFDLIPGVLPRSDSDIRARSRVVRERLLPVVRLIEASLDAFDPRELARLAKFLEGDLPERFPAAAAAWVRLPPGDAIAMTRTWGRGELSLVDARWDDAALAYAAFEGAPAELAAIFRERAGAGAPTPALQKALARGGVDPVQVAESIRKARKPDELLVALKLAAEHRVPGALLRALEKLRESAVRPTPELYAAVIALVDDDNEALVEQEIDGENPFRDRREALRAALAVRSG